MKINPFQGMMDHSMLTNKLLGTMNTNMSNLISEIRNMSNSSPTKQLNKDLAETQIPINNILSLFREIEQELKACGNIELAKGVQELEQQCYSANSNVDNLMKQLKSQLEETFNPETAYYFESALDKIVNPTITLEDKLKSVEQQLRACGETAKANKIKEYMQETQKKTIDVDSSINELRADIEKCFGTDAVNDFNKKLNETDSKVKNISKKSDFGGSLKTALGIGTVALGIRKAFSFVKEATTGSVDFVETQNLFNVSMGKTVDQYGNLDKEASRYYTKAIAFQEKLSEKLCINIEESMNYQALFNAMSKSMGISADYAYKLSENFTKLGYDLSSLYNIEPENAMQKLRAGLSGQTKPLRDLGMDITQQSIEPLLDQLGIERSAKQLSQAEKMIARYILVLKQASLAHGDFAKTMDSPANQLRIFNAQITAFKRNIGNLWQGLLGGILPYINAIMMVINELLKMVAKLFGFKVETQNISTGIGADDLASDLGTANKKAKELKAQLMGFDEINNITLPDNSSSGAGGAGAGGIDQRLLDAMKEYDNLMDKVKSKANEIRDKMMEWLGFHRTEDGWKLNDGLTNAEKILEVMKAIGIAILGWKVSKTIATLLEKLGVISKGNGFKYAFGFTLALTGIYLLYKGMKHILDGEIEPFTILETALGAGTLSIGIATLLKTGGYVQNLRSGLKIGFGITLALVGIFMEYNATKKMLEGDISLGTILQGTGSAFLIGIGTWLITGNPVAGLIGTAGVLAFNLGIEIGMALQEVDWQGIWNNITSACSKAWSCVVDFFTKAVPEWWNDNIAPWFTKEKWQELGENIKNGLSDKWNEFKDWWGDTALVQWWNNNVCPWFTKDKWQEEGEKAKEGLENKFNEFKEQFKTIEDWWDEKIAPWFTKEKWQQETNNAKTGIEDKFNEWKNNFKPIQDWFNDKVKPWFTWEKWQQLGRDAVDAIQGIFSNFDFHIKTPHLSWTSEPADGWIAKTLSALNLPTSLPKLNVSWYANGGLPTKGELFMAREAGPELVGKMGNHNAVANNTQIVDGIKEGVYEAVMNAMTQQDGGTLKVEIVADEKGIFKVVQQSAKEFTMQTGEQAFNF